MQQCALLIYNVLSNIKLAFNGRGRLIFARALFLFLFWSLVQDESGGPGKVLWQWIIRIHGRCYLGVALFGLACLLVGTGVAGWHRQTSDQLPVRTARHMGK